MNSLKDILVKGFSNQLLDRKKYVTKEFQDYGYRLALKLGDLKRVSMYIKIAKEKPRVTVEQAFSFSVDYPNAKNKGKLFLWKLKQLEEENKNADKKV